MTDQPLSIFSSVLQFQQHKPTYYYTCNLATNLRPYHFDIDLLKQKRIKEWLL